MSRFHDDTRFCCSILREIVTIYRLGSGVRMEQMDLKESYPQGIVPTTEWGRLPNGAEIVRYDAPMFFSFTEHSLLSQYPNMRAECHWHIDFEFTYVIRGHMWYFVNGKTIRIDEGQAIFVNSRQLHYGFTKDGTDCEFSCVLLNPARMCASAEVYERFIASLAKDDAFPYAVFRSDDGHGGAVIEQIMRLHNVKFGRLDRTKRDDLPPMAGTMALSDDMESLTVLSCFYQMIRELTMAARDRGNNGMTVPSVRHSHVIALGMMCDFVRRQYTRQITLEQIAESGAVGRTACAAIFRELLNQTPIEFVNDVRVRSAANLLTATQLPIATIASRTGFSSTSYFTRTFRHIMHITPLRYRNNAACGSPMDSASQSVVTEYR